MGFRFIRNKLDRRLYAGFAYKSFFAEAVMSMEQTIREKLTDTFTPQSLEVVNDSHRHAGHASSPGTGESHFRVEIVSDKFTGLSRVERHRLVNEALAAELSGEVHALAMKTLAPGE
jgi:stress-induced morphogen